MAENKVKFVTLIDEETSGDVIALLNSIGRNKSALITIALRELAATYGLSPDNAEYVKKFLKSYDFIRAAKNSGEGPFLIPNAKEVPVELIKERKNPPSIGEGIIGNRKDPSVLYEKPAPKPVPEPKPVQSTASQKVASEGALLSGVDDAAIDSALAAFGL